MLTCSPSHLPPQLFTLYPGPVVANSYYAATISTVFSTNSLHHCCCSKLISTNHWQETTRSSSIIIHTMSQNQATILLSPTSPNLDRFSKIFLVQTSTKLQWGHHKVFHHTLNVCYTTMQNINVKKVAIGLVWNKYRVKRLIDWVNALHPTWHKTDHFGDALPSQSLASTEKKQHKINIIN